MQCTPLINKGIRNKDSQVAALINKRIRNTVSTISKKNTVFVVHLVLILIRDHVISNPNCLFPSILMFVLVRDHFISYLDSFLEPGSSFI